MCLLLARGSLGGTSALPGLRGDLNGIPGTSEWGRVAQIEIVDAVDRHAEKERCGVDVDTLGHFGLPGPDNLRPEQLPRLCITGNPQPHALSARVVRLVVPGLGINKEEIRQRQEKWRRIEPQSPGQPPEEPPPPTHF